MSRFGFISGVKVYEIKLTSNLSRHKQCRNNHLSPKKILVIVNLKITTCQRELQQEQKLYRQFESYAKFE
jgi:hypothetical protein